MSVKEEIEKEWQSFKDRAIVYRMPEYVHIADEAIYGHEPEPILNQGPCIQDLAIDDCLTAGHKLLAKAIELRKIAGVEKYKTVLQPNNGRNPRMDLYQELLDAIVYARQALYEAAHSTSEGNADCANMRKIYLATIQLAEHVRKSL
jgi:hypothetical protein